MMPSHPSPSREALLAHLRSGAAALVPSERRVAEVLVRDFHRLERYSAALLAEAAQCSPATVVRACQRLGFSGFQQLRTQAIRCSIDGQGAAKPSGETHPKRPAQASCPEPGPPVLEKVFAAAQADLEATAAMLDREAFGKAVTALCSAQTILLVGTGGSSIPAQDAALRFTMSGRTALAPADVLGQQFTARLLKPLDVCIAVSYSGANRHTMEAARAAHVAGASVIAVTSSGLSALARTADIALVTGTAAADTEILASRISHTLVLNALNLVAQQRTAAPAFGPARELEELLGNVLQGPGPKAAPES